MIFDDIVFNRQDHTYQLYGKNLDSTTELITKLQKEVDWDAIAAKKATKTGVDKAELVKTWKAKGNQAIHIGTKVHHYIEHRLKSEAESNNEMPNMVAWEKFWEQAKANLFPVKIEWIIGDYDLKIGGTIDCLFYSLKTNKHHIFDWKTGQELKFNNPFQMLLPPFEDLEDCNFLTYSLQLGVYKTVLKRNTDIELGDSYIIKLTEDQFTSVKALDLTNRAEAWLCSR